jgi:hypothetical protein
MTTHTELLIEEVKKQSPNELAYQIFDLISEQIQIFNKALNKEDRVEVHVIAGDKTIPFTNIEVKGYCLVFTHEGTNDIFITPATLAQVRLVSSARRPVYIDASVVS